MSDVDKPRADLAAREATDAKMVALGFGGIDAALKRIGELEAELREAAEWFRDGEGQPFVVWLNAFVERWGTKGDAS